MENSHLIPLEGKEIRKEWHNEQWYFSVVDVIEVLTDSPTPSKYWEKVKKRMKDETLKDLSPNWGKLKLKGLDGKSYPSDCANTEGILRIVMSVPSPKAEPLKLWMAQVGKERLDETENPELSFERMTLTYKAQGYTDDWIKERIQSIDIRKKLTDEWKKRDVKEGKEFSILTAIIAKGTFGLTPTEHKDLKGLTKPSQNLRDHMTDLELILTSLGEAVTRTVAIEEDARGFEENKGAAVKGGQAGGQARKNVEKITGKKVVSSENFLKTQKGMNALPKNTEGEQHPNL
jgi:DNA-damage-inducible protein D